MRFATHGLVKIDALCVVVLMEVNGEIEAQTLQNSELSLNDWRRVFSISSVEINVIFIASFVVDESPWVKTRENQNSE